MIQLICSDIDGTLLDKNRQLALKTIKEIKRLKHIPFILISSRMPKAMFHLQEELAITHLPIIAYNGGLIMDKNKIISSTVIAPKNIQTIADFCKNTQIHTSLYYADEWYVPTMDYWAKREAHNTKVTPTVQAVNQTIKQWKTEKKGAHKIMCMGEKEEIDALVSFLEKNLDNTIIGYRSKDTYLEIAPKKVTKKTAIISLLASNYPTINFENIMAFGDNYNDVAMLKAVGVGVAVANAKPAVLAIAKYKTDSNKYHGVGLFLSSYFKE